VRPGHKRARVGGTGYWQSREEIATIVHKWKWPDAWLGNLLGIPWNSAIIPNPDLLNSGIFIGISFFQL
jgi:hypothetical protein